MGNTIKSSEVGVRESSDSSVSAVSSKLDNYSSGERSVMARFISGGISNRAMVVLMSITGFSAQGCRADLLPPPQLTFAEGFVDTDASDGEKADGTFVIDSFDTADVVDGGIDDAMDGSTDDTVSEIGEDVVDGDSDDAVAEVEDTTDAVDGGIDDAMDGSTDDTISEIGEDVLDGNSDDAVVEVEDTTDAVDGGIDDAMDGSTDDTILEVADITDAADGGVDDSMDGSTDDTILEVGGDVMDEDLNDIISEVVDSVDATEPLKTCDGKPVGTVQIIPTKGPNGEVGICVNGKEICSPVGVWEIQSAPVDPAIAGEICSDSLDNDCNGVTDEVPCSCDGNVDGLVDMDKFDPLFKSFVLGSLGKKPNDTITVKEASQVIEFMVKSKGLTSIAGAECFPNTEIANFGLNNLVDISPLSYLLKLKEIYLGKNLIVDLSPLKNLIALEIAILLENPVQDISPLILNNGIGQGDTVDLSGNTNIPTVQVKALKDKGVTVIQ